jgi:hypothetical protein
MIDSPSGRMSNARRKLLQGTAAAPLILTVRPAAATARSSLVACIERDAKRKPEYIMASNASRDDWMRTKVDILELTIWDSDKKKWVELKDRKFFLGFDKTTYWECDRNDPWRSPAAPSSYRKGINVREEKKGDRDAIVYVSQSDGRVVGMGWEKNGGYHCTRSCWTSLVPKGAY